MCNVSYSELPWENDYNFLLEWKTLERLRKNVKYSLSASWSRMGGVEVELHSFLASALDTGEWPASSSCRLGAHWQGGWVGARDSLDVLDKTKIIALTGMQTSDHSERYTKA
jgi:hypothetical protein